MSSLRSVVASKQQQSQSSFTKPKNDSFHLSPSSALIHEPNNDDVMFDALQNSGAIASVSMRDNTRNIFIGYCMILLMLSFDADDD